MGDNISFAQNHGDNRFSDQKADLSENHNIYAMCIHSHQTLCQSLVLFSFLLRLGEHFKAELSERCPASLTSSQHKHIPCPFTDQELVRLENYKTGLFSARSASPSIYCATAQPVG